MSSALAHALREGLYLVVLLSAPPVLAVLVAGAASALLQTVTQVRDGSLSAAPKVVEKGPFGLDVGTSKVTAVVGEMLVGQRERARADSRA